MQTSSLKKWLLRKDMPGGGIWHAAGHISAGGAQPIKAAEARRPWARVRLSYAPRLPARAQSFRCPPISSLPPPRRPPAVSWSRRSHRARRCCPPAPAAAPSRTQGRETARQRTPPDAARGVPAASRPAHGGGSNARCAGKRRPQRRGPPAAAPPPLPPWAAGCVVYPAAVPPHQVLARLRACDNCRPVRA